MKPGQLVTGKYRLDARLGIGGMGEVWKATHTGTGREFALKFMHAHAAASNAARQRFTREARVSAKINHPNVIDIFDVGEFDEVPYLAMELLEGVSLAEAFHADHPLSAQDLLSVMLDTTRALAAAHAAGVVHRDVKPGNIFLHRDRATGFATAKILDFGISKIDHAEDSHHTKTGAVLGSPRYMSPEQARSASAADLRADIWSVGVILFEGLTGTWPHEGDSFSSLVVAICTTPPNSIDAVAPELPEPLRALVRDCLRPLALRVQSAGELADRIAAVVVDPSLAHLPLPRPLHPPSETVKSVSGVRVRPPLLTTTGGLGLGALPSPESMAPTQQRIDGAPVTPAARYQDDDATRVHVGSATASPALALPAPPPLAPPSSPSVSAPLASPSSPGAPSPLASPSSPGAPSPLASPSSPGAPSPLATALMAQAPSAPSPFAAPSIHAVAPPPLAAPPHFVAASLASAQPLTASGSLGTARMPQPQLAPAQALRTVPLQAGAALREDLVRSGLLAPPPTPAPFVTPASSPVASNSARLVIAVLAAAVISIAVALVVVLRAPAPSSAAASSSASVTASAAPPAPRSAEPAHSASAAPPAATTTASADHPPPPAADKRPGRAPEPAPPPGPRPRTPSKVQRLGSGL